MRTKRTDEEFAEAVAQNMSMRQTLLSLGMSATGSGYSQAKKRIKRLGLDTSHWLGQASNRGRKFPSREIKPLEEILVKESSYGRGPLKRRLLQGGLLRDVCYECGLTDWQGKPITLQLDHINGVNDDNRLENLRLLCPNCHSQTKTFAGRRLRSNPKPCPDCGGPKGHSSARCQPCHVKFRYGKSVSHPIQVPAGTRNYETELPQEPVLVCPTCRGPKSIRASRCKRCTGLGRRAKTQWPPLDSLLQEIRDTNFSAVGKRLGVSDNAVRKHLKVRLGPDWKSHL